MVMNVSFNFTCTCGRAGSVLVPEPIILGSLMLAPDCKSCGNTIIVSPQVKHGEGMYDYHVRICKTEREEKKKIP